MQLTQVFLNRSLPPIGNGGHMPVKTFSVGMACLNQAYGGGTVASITLERNGAILIRKDCPFTVKDGTGKTTSTFDFVAVFPGGEYAYGLDEKPAQTKGK